MFVEQALALPGPANYKKKKSGKFLNSRKNSISGKVGKGGKI